MIISFYSYKGGVGRTQLCANIAAYLSIYKNKKVLLWDWDFEAPGLHVYFEKTIEEINVDGTVEIFYNFVKTMRSRSHVKISDCSFIEKENIFPLYSENDSNGRIDLLPAGNYSKDFAQKVSNFNWYEFYEFLDGFTYIEKLKESLNQLGYDYIFIDSRTGISDYSGICNVQLPALNIILMAANEQNFKGCKSIAKQIIESDYAKSEKYRKPLIIPVLSRLDFNDKSYVHWLRKFTDDFSYLLKFLDNKVDDDFIHEVFEEIYLDLTILPYYQSISNGENILFKKSAKYIPKMSFERKIVNISDYIENINEKGAIDIYTQIDKDTWLNYATKAEKQNNVKKQIIALQHAGEF